MIRSRLHRVETASFTRQTCADSSGRPLMTRASWMSSGSSDAPGSRPRSWSMEEPCLSERSGDDGADSDEAVMRSQPTLRRPDLLAASSNSSHARSWAPLHDAGMHPAAHRPPRRWPPAQSPPVPQRPDTDLWINFLKAGRLFEAPQLDLAEAIVPPSAA